MIVFLFLKYVCLLSCTSCTYVKSLYFLHLQKQNQFWNFWYLFTSNAHLKVAKFGKVIFQKNKKV